MFLKTLIKISIILFFYYIVYVIVENYENKKLIKS